MKEVNNLCILIFDYQLRCAGWIEPTVGTAKIRDNPSVDFKLRDSVSGRAQNIRIILELRN